MLSSDTMESKVAMITCQICLDMYKKPKYLSCLHTFCEDCLQSYITNVADICKKLDKLPASIFDSSPFVWSGDGFPCPACRSHVQVAKARHTPVKEWAGLFPTNHLVLSIMGLDSVSVDESMCDPCNKIDEPKSAQFWCKECAEPLCSTCAKHHRVLKATIKHSVIGITELKERPESIQHEEITICQKHLGKTVDKYCVDHNKVACMDCVSEKHLSCVDVISINKVAGEIRDSSEAHKLLDKLKECAEETECIVLNRKRVADKLSASKETVIKKMVKIKEDVIKTLDDLQRIFEEDFEVSNTKILSDLEDQVGRCELLQKAIDSSAGILKAAISHGTDNELFVVAHRMEKELHKYERVLENEAVNINEIDYDFETNYEIEHILLNIDEIGSLKVHKTPTIVSPFVKKKADLLVQFPATSPMDERCAELTGGTFLPDDRLLLVDNANEKLKLFTQGGDLISELELSSAPWDITAIPGGMAAVTLPEEKKIMMVSGLNDCITPVEQFSTSGKCYGISYSYHDKDLVVTCDSSLNQTASVKVLSVSGTEIRDILESEEGQRLMSRPGYIATSPFNSDVYVSDECNDNVIGITMKGEFRFRLSESYHKLPVGISADNHGCVYVCGNGSCDIQQISGDGQRSRLLMDGMSHPRAIAFDPYGDRFLVTSDGSYKSSVQVYAMS